MTCREELAAAEVDAPEARGRQLDAPRKERVEFVNQAFTIYAT